MSSFLFRCWFYSISALLIVLCVPVALVSAQGVRWFYRQWARLTAWGLKTFLNVHVVVRGLENLPNAPVLLACKHYSAAETALLFGMVPNLAPVVKQELLQIPFARLFLQRLGGIPINRAARGESIRAMTDAVLQQYAHGRQVLIFPEGTRRPVGAPPRYQRGVLLLRQHLRGDCVPVALNTGVFWAHNGVMRGNGQMIFEFLPAIPAHVPDAEFMDVLQKRIEAACARLCAESRLIS
jgi:1-acyl-sn-glycerol-3-phosphate acyltransferase